MENVFVKRSNQWKKILVQPYERFIGHLPEGLLEDALTMRSSGCMCIGRRRRSIGLASVDVS